MASQRTRCSQHKICHHTWHGSATSWAGPAGESRIEPAMEAELPCRPFRCGSELEACYGAAMWDLVVCGTAMILFSRAATQLPLSSTTWTRGFKMSRMSLNFVSFPKTILIYHKTCHEYVHTHTYTPILIRNWRRPNHCVDPCTLWFLRDWGLHSGLAANPKQGEMWTF